jgi:serine protease 16
MQLLLLLAIASIAFGQVLHHQGKLYFSDGSSSLLGKGHASATGASLLMEQPVDHFNASNSTATYMQRYFVNDTQWDKSNPLAPILLCVGGEGPPLDASVLVDSVHCSDMVQYSQQKRSLTFAIEHRFYGSSLPTGMDFSTNNLNLYLSTEQAAQDIRSFIIKMKADYAIPDSAPWITFGGSYPGMLSAISHQVSPDLIFATVASSAPLQAVVEFPGYNEVVGEAYKNPLVGGSDACYGVISDGHAQIQRMLANAEGRRQLESDFNVCGHSALDNAMNQVLFASDGVAYFPAQSNDPSCTDDLCNIAKVCVALLGGVEDSAYSRLMALSRAQNGNTCKFVSHDALVAAYMPSNSPSRIWQFQTCSEWGFYLTCPVGSKCPFVQGLASLDSSFDICKKAFGIEEETIRDNVDKANRRYGGSKFKCERVLFVNGEVDPWRASSVQEDTGFPSEPIHLSPGTSHHFWTHEPLPDDGKYVSDSRATIYAQLDEWLAQIQNS